MRDFESGDNVFPNKRLGVHIPDIGQGLVLDPFSEVVHAD